MTTLRAPFPWFGGKSRAAPLVWRGLGNVPNYVEPFAGSLAVLLARPHAPRVETVNDRDAYLSNFWRATQRDPGAVAEHADWPVSEADIHARHLSLVNRADFRERMLTDPEFYDAKLAGWWVWGVSAWLGSGWCDVDEREREREREQESGRHGRCPTSPSEESIAPASAPLQRRAGDASKPSQAKPSQQVPFLGNRGRGVHRPPPTTFAPTTGTVRAERDPRGGLRGEL